MVRLPWRRFLGPLAVMALGAAACGGGSSVFPDDAVAIRASTDIGVGSERLLIGVRGSGGEQLGSPEEPVTIEIAPSDDAAAIQSNPATFVWILEDVVGLYRADFDFDRPGTWQATVVAEDGSRLDPVVFLVFDEPLAPAVGAVAPLPPTPTLADHTIEELTTDTEPDLSFYQLSLQDAVTSGRPTVVVFSTPAYCVTSACGPLLNVVKAVAPSHADVNFVHVEVFTGLTDPGFLPDSAHLAEAVTEPWYRLPSEPWVFVIDQAGKIAGRFEGVMDQGELTEVLEMISL